MGTTETLTVIIDCGSDVKTSGTVTVRRRDKIERVLRSLKGLGICWLIAAFSVLIPILHFILVPLFFLLGPLVYYILYSSESGVLGGKGICPKCSQEFSVVAVSEKWPLRDVCNHCRAHVVMNPQS